MKAKKIIPVCLALGVMLFNLTPASAAASDTKNVTVSFIVDPTITLTIDNATLAFGSVAPATATHDAASAVTATVQSNMNFDLSLKGTDFSDGSGHTVLINKLQVKENSQPVGSYVALATTDTDILTNQAASASTAIPLDFRLNTDLSIVPGTYTSTVTITASV